MVTFIPEIRKMGVHTAGASWFSPMETYMKVILTRDKDTVTDVWSCKMVRSMRELGQMAYLTAEEKRSLSLATSMKVNSPREGRKDKVL